MQIYEVPAPLFQAMANRLSAMPYREVADVLNPAAALRPIDKAEPTPETASAAGDGAAG